MITHRNTQQRRAILDYLRNTVSHPRAEDIYVSLKSNFPSLSFGTVYRNLRILSEIGEIQELRYGNSASRFDGNTTNHPHFTCEICGNVFDIEEEFVKLDKVIFSGVKNFVIKSYRLELFGSCLHCKNSHS